MPTNHSTSSAMFRTSLASLTSGPPHRASIPVLALEAQPPTGLPSRPTCRGAGPLQVLTTRGFAGDSRQASPVRPVYNADQPITALKGTGIRTLGPASRTLFETAPFELTIPMPREGPRLRISIPPPPSMAEGI